MSRSVSVCMSIGMVLIGLLQVKAAPAPSAPSFRRLWSWQGDKPVAGVPVWDGLGWLALTTDSRLTSLDANGRVRWSAAPATNAVFATEPAVVTGLVVAVSTAGSVHAWALADGARRWQASLPGPFAHAPVTFMRDECSAAAAVVAPADGRIYCLNAVTGARVWVSEPTQRTDGPLATGGGLLAFGNCDAAIYAVSALDGSIRARIPVGEDAQMAGGVAIADGRAFGGTRDGRLVAVDLAAQRVVWSVQVAEGELFTTPALSAACVFAGTGEGDLVALRRDTGEKVWRRKIGASAGSPVLAISALWVVCDGRVLALNPADGSEWFAFAAGDRVSGPVAGSRQVAVTDDAGGIMVFGRNGEP